MYLPSFSTSSRGLPDLVTVGFAGAAFITPVRIHLAFLSAFLSRPYCLVIAERPALCMV